MTYVCFFVITELNKTPGEHHRAALGRLAVKLVVADQAFGALGVLDAFFAIALDAMGFGDAAVIVFETGHTLFGAWVTQRFVGRAIGISSAFSTKPERLRTDILTTAALASIGTRYFAFAVAGAFG